VLEGPRCAPSSTASGRASSASSPAGRSRWQSAAELSARRPGTRRGPGRPVRRDDAGRPAPGRRRTGTAALGLAIAEALACGTPALLPAGLGTAPELLAADGGCTYHDARDLRAILTASGPPTGKLPAALDWDATAAATVGVYQALREARKAA
jgi:hypothetical protein